MTRYTKAKSKFFRRRVRFWKFSEKRRIVAWRRGIKNLYFKDGALEHWARCRSTPEEVFWFYWRSYVTRRKSSTRQMYWKTHLTKAY